MAKLGLANKADEIKARLRTKQGGSESASLPSMARAKLFQQIGDPGERFEKVDSQVKFEDPTQFSEIEKKSDTRYADLGHIGGEFAQTPSAKSSIVRTSRESPDAPTAEEKKIYRGGLSSLSGEVDHIIPLWLGGSNKPQNLRVIPKEQHRNVVTRVQKAVEYLYRNPALAEKYFGRKLSLAEARNYAINAPSAAESAFNGLKFDEWGAVKGKNLEDQVKKSAQILNRFSQDPNEIGILDILKPKNLREAGETAGEWFGEKMPDTAAGEFAKGLVSGLTLGHITYAEENPDMSAKNQLSGMVGSIVGGLASMMLGGVVIKGGLKAVGAATGLAETAEVASAGAKLSKGKKFFDAVKRINPAIAKGIEKAVQPTAKAIDVKSKKGILSKVFQSKATKAASEAGNLKDSMGILEAFKPSFKQGFKKRFLEDAAIFGTIGQLSRQDDQELSTRAKRLATDLAYGGLTASVPGGLSKKLATVWVGAGIIDSIAGASPSEAATNATIMTLFHGIGGFRNSGLSEKAIDEYATQVASKTRNKWLNKIGRDAVVPEGSLSKDGNLSTRLKELEDSLNAETDNIFREIDNNVSMTDLQKAREKQAVLLSGKQLFTRALPEDMRGSVMFEDMQSMAKRLKEEGDAISLSHKKADAMSRASSNLEPIPEDAPTSAIFTTRGVKGELSESSAEDIARAFANETLNMNGNKMVPKGNTEAFLVKLPELEARSVEKRNPSVLSDVSTVHSQNVYELQMRDSNGNLYHLGLADESAAQKMFGDLRRDNIEHVEAKVDYISISDGKIEVQASVPTKAVERAQEFNSHVEGESEGFKTQKETTVREETPKQKIEEETVQQEYEPSETVEPRMASYKKAKGMADRQSTPDELMEMKSPVKEGGQFSFPETRMTAEKTRNEMRAKFKKDDIDRAVRFDVPLGNAQRGIEVAMSDKTLMNSIRDTAIALQRDGLDEKIRRKLTSQANRFKDELINEREIDLREIERIGRTVLKTKYKTKKTIDPTIGSIVKDKMASGLDRDKALEEAVEDRIALELMGTPMKEVKEIPTESQLDIAKRVRKYNEKQVLIDSTEGELGPLVDSAEIETVPKTKRMDTPFTESPSRAKARAAGKIVEVRGQEPKSLEAKGKIKDAPRDATGATEEQSRIMSKVRQRIDNVIESTDRPKKELPKEFRERMMAEIEEQEMKGLTGESQHRTRRIDVKLEAEGRKPLENPYLPGKPTGAYVGYGEVLTKSQIDELDEYAKMAIKRREERIKAEEPSGRSKKDVSPEQKMYNAEYVNKMIDGGSPEEAILGEKLNEALRRGDIDGQNNEFFDAIQALKKNDSSYIMKNNVLRYLKEFSEAADDADDAFELAVANKTVSDIDVNRKEFVRAMVDIENADLDKVPNHIIRLEPIRSKIMELDPTVEFRVKDLMIEKGMAEDAAMLRALKEAKNRKEMDIEIINKGHDAFEEEVKNGKIRDVGDNKERFLEVYFHADGTGANQDILRLDSIKNRLKKDVEFGLDIAGKTEFSGKSWGLSKSALNRAVKDVKAIREGKDASFSYVDSRGETKPIKNAVSMAIRDSSDTAKNKIVKDFWDIVEDETAAYGATKKAQGKTDFREWRVDNPTMIFNSSARGNTGMNRHVKMSETQADAYMWFHNSDIQSVNFEQFLDVDKARKMSAVQEIIERRVGENIDAINKSKLTQEEKRKLLRQSDKWLTAWTKPEPTLKPLEISVTNIGRAVDRMETPFGKELLGMARGADEVRAVEDYLGTGSDALLAKYDHLAKYALEYDMADMNRVSLEHARAKERGEIGSARKDTTTQEQKLLDEMEDSSGFDETFGEVIDQNFIPTEEYSVADISIHGLNDPSILAYLESLPSDVERRAAIQKNARLVAAQIVDATEEVIRTTKYAKGKRFKNLLDRAQELREAKNKQKDLLQDMETTANPERVDTELAKVKATISKLEKRPYRAVAKNNPRWRKLEDSLFDSNNRPETISKEAFKKLREKKLKEIEENNKKK